MEVQAILEARRSERDVLLQRAQSLLTDDLRIDAAWLFGSLGRGDADALSDIDLFLVVEDIYTEEVIAARHAQHIARLGTPLLILEAPQNAPPQGAYNMALYRGVSGPHQVDWYWQPRSAARIPQQTRLLLDRVGLPRQDSPPHFDYQPAPERNRLEVISQAVNFFWVMLLITAKYIARSPQEEKMGLLKSALAPLREVREFVGLPAALALTDDTTFPSPAAKLGCLRELATEMDSLLPQVVARGGHVPEEIISSAYCYLNLIAAMTVSPSEEA
jgi:hypothetical protein